MTKDITILVVDDDPDVLGVVSKQLGKSNYRVKTANNGKTALQAAEKLIPDLVLLDVNLPEMNGFEVCNKIKMNAETEHIPVMFFTGDHYADTITRAFKAGGDDYLMKPFTRQELLARVDRIIDNVNNKKELERSEKKLRSVLKNSPDFVFSVDPSGKVIYTNVENSGTKQFIFDFFEELPQQKWVHHLTLAFQQQNTIQFEMQISNGQCYHVRIHAMPGIQIDQTALIIITDISERKKAEHELQVSKKRYQLLLENQSDGVVLVNSNTRQIEFCNPAAAIMFNQSLERMRQRDLNDFIPSTIYESILDKIQDYHLQENLTFETTYCYGNNRERHLLVTVSHHPSVYGEETRYFFVIRDVTVRTHVRNQLRFQLLWEKTATALTTQFINQPLSQIEDNLQNALMHVNDFLKSSRCYVVQFDESYTIQNIYLWPDLNAGRAAELKANIQNFYTKPQQLFSESDIFLAHQAATPSKQEKDFLEKLKADAHLSCGFFKKDVKIMLCVDWQETQLDLFDKYVPFLRISTEIFSNVLVRVKVEHTLAKYRDHLEQLVHTRTKKLDEANKNLRQEIRHRESIEKELEQFNQQLRHLSSHLIAAREQERTIVAREIHDELGQTLTALNLDVGWLAAKSKKEAPLLYEHIDKMGKMVVGTMKKVQQIISHLRPTILDNLGLVDALDWQVKEYQIRTSIRIELDIDREIQCTDELATVIFRICQEGMTNIIRHSKAEHAGIVLKRKENQLILTIKDDGIGLPAEKLKENSSFGLMGIHERAFSCGGTVEISSVKGTLFSITFPYCQVVPLVGLQHAEMVTE